MRSRAKASSTLPSSSIARLACVSLLASVLVASSVAAQVSFIAFESGPVRPVALSPDGSQVFVTNIPDNTLEVFDVSGGSLTFNISIPVGLEPVAVAARTDDEIWVVNHLSDSVSVIDLSATPPQVVRTLLVGDEPRDIVFAGTGGNRAFVTTAHRGQHRVDGSLDGVPKVPGVNNGDPQLTTAGVGRADVWVFDGTNLGNTIGGTPVEILTFFADTPRALAVSPDGNTVYAAAFHSGNETTVINETLIPDGFGAGGVPGPDGNFAGAAAPETGVIVKNIGGNWIDAGGNNRNSLVNLGLPDQDVFSINANSLASGSVVHFDHVGTILFNMVANPITGKIYVTNTELPNHVRFEGPGDHGGSTVQGRLSESRITVLDPAGPSVDSQHLNQHIDYSKLHTDVPDNVDPTAKNHSLATPLQPIVSSDGNTLYVAAFGSGKIGVFDTADIEDPSFEANFDPTVKSANYIETPGGPAGLVLDEVNGRLYVLTRFDNQVVVIDTATKAVTEVHPLHTVEPTSVVEGRPFLYDALETSGNGEASCSSCHIFADFDSLAWNLGDPDGSTSINNQPSSSALPPSGTFHPMKGPMTTQTLRGLATHGGMHWRGDRVDGFFGTDPCTEPTGAPCSEDLSFRNFIVAFEGLVGRDGTISSANMQKFTDFILQVMLPPNPVAALDNSLTTAQEDGLNIFNGPISDTVENCDGCHDLIPGSGFFGSAGEQSFEGEPQNAKVPHMRNMYQKIGMFNSGNAEVRGFGFLHDGSVDTLKTFVSAGVFSLSNAEEDDLEEFSLAFPTDIAPIVGQQVTLTSTNAGVVNPRIDLMIARDDASFTSLMLGGSVTDCDLIVKGSVGGDPRGWVREPGGLFRDDEDNTISDVALRALATSEGPLTYTAVYPGAGTRAGVDRDEDTVLDGSDNCPAVSNLDQTDTDMDGIGDACEAIVADSDGDGVPDSTDNCVAIPNAGQENFDGDTLGDACDDDDDNDGLDDVVETNTGTFVSPTDTGSDPMNADSDGDGFGDGLEVSAGSDPNDSGSVPAVSQTPALPPSGQFVLMGLLAGAGLAARRWRVRL
jgi:YVTN family beta-propeller protein